MNTANKATYLDEKYDAKIVAHFSNTICEVY